MGVKICANGLPDHEPDPDLLPKPQRIEVQSLAKALPEKYRRQYEGLLISNPATAQKLWDEAAIEPKGRTERDERLEKDFAVVQETLNRLRNKEWNEEEVEARKRKNEELLRISLRRRKW